MLSFRSTWQQALILGAFALFNLVLLLVWAGMQLGVDRLLSTLDISLGNDQVLRVFQIAFAVITLVPVLLYAVTDFAVIAPRVRRSIEEDLREAKPPKELKGKSGEPPKPRKRLKGKSGEPQEPRKRLKGKSGEPQEPHKELTDLSDKSQEPRKGLPDHGDKEPSD